MVSFQQDLLITLNNYNKQYNEKFDEVFTNDELMSDLNFDEVEKLIEYIKEYRKLIDSICLVLSKINNIKKDIKVQNRLEDELMVKMIPLMNIYRTLLLEKYRSKEIFNNSINDID